MNRLFKEYQKPLLRLANNRFGRKFLGIEEKDKIIQLTPNLYVAKFGNKFKVKAFCADEFAQRLRFPLSAVDILKSPFKKIDEYAKLSTYKGLLNYAGLLKDNRFPFVLLTDTGNLIPSYDKSMRIDAAGSWASQREATSADVISAAAPSYAAMYCDFGGGEYSALTRAFFPIDLSAIPPSAVFSAGTFKHFTSGTVDPSSNINAMDLVLTKATPADPTNMVMADFDQITLNSPPEGSNARCPNEDWNHDGDSHEYTLNATGYGWATAAVGGYLTFCIRNSRDVDNVAPTGMNRPYLDMSGAASGRKPFFTGVYETVSVSESRSPSVSPSSSPAPQGMRMAVGSYTGNGLDNRSIGGVGFQPDLVMLRWDTGGSATSVVWRSSAMVGDTTCTANNTPAFANGIQALEADGFQIGSDNQVNQTGLTYYWVAFKKGNIGDFNVGTYTGNGVDSRNITGLGFQPDAVLIKGSSDNRFTMYHPSTLAGDNTFINQTGGIQANSIQSFLADGFQVGTHNDVNANGETYNWIAFKTNAGFINFGTYAGTGTDDRDITGVGFEPLSVWLAVNPGASQFQGRWATTGDKSWYWNAMSQTDIIQAMQPDGFQVGTVGNSSASGNVYHWFAAKDNPFVPSESLSPSLSLSLSPSVSESRSESLSPSASKSTSPSFSESRSPSVSGSASISPSASESRSPSASVSPSASGSVSESVSESISPSASISLSPSLSASPSSSPSPSPYRPGMITFLDLITAVQSDLTIGDESSLFPLNAVKLAIIRAYHKIGALFKWPETEDAKKTCAKAGQEYYDYPDEWKPDSIWKITVDGQDYGEPLIFKDYLYEVENDVPSGRDYLWASQWRRFFIHPIPTADGEYNISVWGQVAIVDLVWDTDLTIFSYDMPECNEAIVLEAVAILQSKGEDRKGGEMLSVEAKQICVVAWNKVREEQGKYQVSKPFFDVPDLFGDNEVIKIGDF